MDYQQFEKFYEENYVDLIYVLKEVCYEPSGANIRDLWEFTTDYVRNSNIKDLYYMGLNEVYSDEGERWDFSYPNNYIQVDITVSIVFAPETSEYEIRLSYENIPGDTEVWGESGGYGDKLSDFFKGLLDILNMGMGSMLSDYYLFDKSENKFKYAVQRLYDGAKFWETAIIDSEDGDEE